ncbi:putative tail assembly protein [Erwinia phage vB_EamM_Phobos]|uniref:tail assembly chaperone n=1 Tax=Erwinia phage vB_EamM_Phobos TaxID=1883377 RepID=UPI00081CFC53|nr:tail assembly chaperone [Erwinia phage vB_EamM_Phobos]ANZ50350.1 putative tail assembly protein [Erwinia phage vB_EamM_Phobos]
MDKFEYTRLDDHWFILTKDFNFGFTLAGLYEDDPKTLGVILKETGLVSTTPLYLVAPKGFVTDLASIPTQLQFLFKPEGDYGPAACLHDLLYQKIPIIGHYKDTACGKLNRFINKEFADRMFLYVMKQLNVAWLTRQSFYLAVKHFGIESYIDNNKGCIYLKPDAYTFNMNCNYEFVRERPEVAIPPQDMSELYSGRQAHVLYLNIKRSFLSYPIPPAGGTHVPTEPQAV